MRAALYLRVSTVRQAEKDLSIPDQRSQVAGHCQARGWEVVGEYVEAGASGTHENRPQLQRLMADAQGGDAAFDVVVVHSFSRFFRDAYHFEFHRRKLAKHGVQLVSITQETGDDPMGNMVRQILNLFDEYQSKENAKHVLRAMKENARQGFWERRPDALWLSERRRRDARRFREEAPGGRAVRGRAGAAHIRDVPYRTERHAHGHPHHSRFPQ
jgi:DNA invertase Pin-like site-specific DNA recombinase